MNRPRIAVDAMGGDNAPHAVIEGVRAALRSGEFEIVLVGRRDRIDPLLGREGARIERIDASEVIDPGEPPVPALRKKTDSSLVVGLRLVKEGRADAFVSAGSTGALMAGGYLTFGRIPGVHRPAIASLFPTLDGRGSLILDLGAHMDATAEHLFQFAVMGSIYAEKVLGVSRPRVALLNVGSEENKGNELTRQAFTRLQGSRLHFIGNVEGRDIFEGAADVVVCDGFVGNVLLKAMEGMGQGLFKLLRQELRSGWRERLGAALLLPAFRRVAARVDYREYGGAPLLGVNGVVIKCHGSSDGKAIMNGIRVARRVLSQRVVELIRGELAGEGEPI